MKIFVKSLCINFSCLYNFFYFRTFMNESFDQILSEIFGNGKIFVKYLMKLKCEMQEPILCSFKISVLKN